MRSLKPQQALIQTAPTQFGSISMLGVSIGCGFRLSDTRVLLHEASVWQAFTSAPLVTPVMEMALPKHSAEWLLGGHAVCMGEDREANRLIDWEASVALDGVKKTIHCTARAMPWEVAHDGAAQHRAVLAVDYPNAMKDIQGRQNPVGMGVPGALQLMGGLGPTGHPLAAMGPVRAQWASRAELAPGRSSLLDPFGRDGSHMGWPAQMDLRYFQLAPRDQHRHGKEWTEGAPFELCGFGPLGLGFRGHLPAIQAQAMVRRREQEALEPVSLTQQTVWFLPDHDTGVMWWHGMVPIDGVLSDDIELSVVAFREPGRLLSTTRLAEIVAARSSLDLGSAASLRDGDLMPERQRGWTWDLILGAEDHPHLRTAPLAYADLQLRVDEFERTLTQMERNREKAKALSVEVASAPWTQVQALQAFTAPADDEIREALTVPKDGTFSHRRLQSATLPGLHVDNMGLSHAQFVRCDLEGTVWTNCHFEDVAFEDCNLIRSRWEGCSFTRCRFTRSDLSSSTFSHCDQRHGILDLCSMHHASFVRGKWTQMTLQRLNGGHTRMEGIHAESVSWLDCQLPNACWSDLVVLNSSLTDCAMAASTMSQCVFERVGFVGADLCFSTWNRCNGISLNFAQGANLGNAQLSGCSFKNTSWIAVKAEGIRVTDSTLKPLTAPRLHAPKSTWLNCVLTDANLMHADLSASTVRATSLKDANIYGADLRESTVKNCNLIRLQSAWIHGAAALNGSGNLAARLQLVPRRPQ